MMYRIRLRRSALDRVFGGVCGGIGAPLGISGWWVRAAFGAVMLTAWSFALLLYCLLWIILPAQKLVDIPPMTPPDEDEPPRYAYPEAVLSVGGLSVLVGLVLLAENIGILRAANGGDYLAPFMLGIVGLALLTKALRGRA